MAALAAVEARVHRCVWLYSKLVRDGAVDYALYQQHFGAARSSYYRDLSLLQRIGVEIQSERDGGRVVFVRESL